MSKPLILLVGKSASGKTTVAELLESQFGYKTLQSYTTRPKRYEDETGHTFITDTEFDELADIVAYTEYNEHRYCCTVDQIDASDIYVVDVPGVETLFEKYQTERQIIVVYFDASIRTRIDRMLNRHDSDMAIVSRIYTDEEFDWCRKLHKIVWNYKNNECKNIEMYVVDANQSLLHVLSEITGYIEQNYKENDI